MALGRGQVHETAIGEQVDPPTIGQPGGCNPIPLPARIEGGDVVIEFAALADGARHFGGQAGHAGHGG